MEYKYLYARVTWQDILNTSLLRLIEALNYKHRMELAGVPAKNVRKIMRRWNPMSYAMRKEMRALIRDMERLS